MCAVDQFLPSGLVEDPALRTLFLQTGLSAAHTLGCSLLSLTLNLPTDYSEVCDCRDQDGSQYLRLSEPKLLAFLAAAVARVAAVLEDLRVSWSPAWGDSHLGALWWVSQSPVHLIPIGVSSSALVISTLWTKGVPLPALFTCAGQAAPSASAAAECVIEVERLLSDAGKLVPEWAASAEASGGLRQAWLEALVSCSGIEVSHIAMLLAVLQHHVISGVGGLTRPAFIREVKEARCPLSVPVANDPAAATEEGGAMAAADGRYAVLRSPLVAHLAKHSRLARVGEVGDLKAVWERVASLPHAKQSKLVAMSYRR